MGEEILDRLSALEKLVCKFAQIDDNDNITDSDENYPIYDLYMHLQQRVADLESSSAAHRLIVQDMRNELRKLGVSSRNLTTKKSNLTNNKPKLATCNFYYNFNQTVRPNVNNRLRFNNLNEWIVTDSGLYLIHIRVKLDAYRPAVHFQQIYMRIIRDEQNIIITINNDPETLRAKHTSSFKGLHLETTQYLQPGDAISIDYVYKTADSRKLTPDSYIAIRKMN